MEAEIDAIEEMADIGVILFGPDGSWEAVRPSVSQVVSGRGPVDRVTPGLWVLDKSYEETIELRASIGRGAKTGSWLRLPISADPGGNSIASEWGIPSVPHTSSREVIPKAVRRCYRLTLEAVAENLGSLRFANIADAEDHLRKSVSLATGVASVNAGPLLASIPQNARVAKSLPSLFRSGIFPFRRRGGEDGDVCLTFRFPRFDYARRLSARRIPGSGTWKTVPRVDGETDEVFLDRMEDLGSPVFLRAVCHPGEIPPPDHVRSILEQKGEGFRNHFLPGEIRVLMRYYDVTIDHAAVAPKWVKSATEPLLKGLERAAGGPEAAAGSWSAGLAAENIYASSMRKIRDNGIGATLESVWLSAADRLEMLSVISALCESGATLISAYLGSISVRCPNDPEMLMSLTATAWEKGLSLGVGDAVRLMEAGVSAPVDRSQYGGKDVDYALASIAQGRRRRAMYAMDGVQDVPSAKREEAWRRLMS